MTTTSPLSAIEAVDPLASARPRSHFFMVPPPPLFYFIVLVSPLPPLVHVLRKFAIPALPGPPSEPCEGTSGMKSPFATFVCRYQKGWWPVVHPLKKKMMMMMKMKKKKQKQK